ncbi:hypothetical protein KAI58_04575 [Candidatus Gracilibacteria bacterium]|nr:hypothetical protein [Candidatus Gracilibacteria bacterium]
MWRNFLLTGLVLGLSGAIFYTSIFHLDPLGEQKDIAFLAFFVSLFCGLVSFFTFLFFFALELFFGKKLGTKYFLIAFRRSILVALFFCILLVLQLFRLLGMLEVVLLAIFLALVEWAIAMTNE